jgi:photosystem II stability/assembly factor-like uncharacterized protein
MNKFTFLFISLLFPYIVFSQGTASFSQVGPVQFPLNPSVQTTGMGRVSHMIYHPNDSNIIFAVSASGGVFKSSNEGQTWRPLSDMLPQTACATLAINPKNPNVMYLGTGDANYNGGGMGVWKSLNGGATWFQSSYGMGNRLVSAILFTPGDTLILIAACSDGIYKSKDAGASWIKKSKTTSSYRDLTYRPQSNKLLYAATNTFFYRSYDNGESWIQSTVNSNITCAGIKIAICPSDTSRLYCVVWKSGTAPFGGVYKSNNNGASFTLQVDTPNILGYSANGSSQDGQGAYNLAIAVDPKNANILYVGAINIWKSTDQGKSFILKSHWAYGVHADKHGFLFSPFNSNKLFSYHDGGLDLTTDGGNNWTTLEDGLSASEFYKMGSSGLYNDYIIGGLQDNGMDVATDKKFSTVRGGDWGGDFAFDAFDKKMLYENGGLKRNILSHSTGNINGQNGIYLVHPKDSNVLFELTTNVFRTKNLRVTPSTDVVWQQITNISGTTNPAAMAFSKSSKGTFYAAFRSQSLHISVNINAINPTFNKITKFPFNGGEEIKQLETCDYDSNIIYAVTNQNRLLKSADKGITWSSLNRNLPGITIIKFLLDQKSTDSGMYVCTALGVYYRNKTMSNWISFSKGLPTVAQISDMEIVSDGTLQSRLHISTYGRGIWQTDLYNKTFSAPIADFLTAPSSAQSCANTLILVDNSYNSPTARKWQITPSKGWNFINGTDSFSARPEIRFNTAGVYFISLTVNNFKGSHTKTINYNYSNLSVPANCNSTTTNLGGYTIGIYRFELNGIDKSSSTGNTSYEDFSCANNTILKAGASYSAWVTNGNAYNENSKIYIDYNNNGVFTDANELVGTISSGLGRRSCTFTTLLNPPVLNKFIRLRVVSDYNSVTGQCGVLAYGQTEDYAIIFDKTKPTLTIEIPKPKIHNSFNVSFKASEMIFGLDAKDVKVSNGTLINFLQIDAVTYTAAVVPVNNGMVTLSINANSFSDYNGNFNGIHQDSTNFFVGINAFTFNGKSLMDSIVQNGSGGKIYCEIPYGVKTDSLIASFILTDSATVYLGSKKQVSGINVNDFSTELIYTVKAPDTTHVRTYSVHVKNRFNTECDLLSFGTKSPKVQGIITQQMKGGTVELTLPFGSKIDSLTAIFNISERAKAFLNGIEQISGSGTVNFGQKIVYKIVAEDTSIFKLYEVNVRFGKSKACDLLSFSIKNPAVTGIISQEGVGGKVKLRMPFRTDISNLISVFSVSDSAKVILINKPQISGITANDFSKPLYYKVLAEDTGIFKVYEVSVEIEPNSEAELLTYSIVKPFTTSTITPTSFGGYVTVSNPSFDVKNLVAQFTLSDSASAYIKGIRQNSTVTTNDFTDTVELQVLAQDKIHTKRYLIKAIGNIINTSVLENENIRIFPNPAKRTLQVSSQGILLLNSGFKIVNLPGQIVLAGNLAGKNDEIDISSIPAGIYYLYCFIGDRFVVGKFVKE